MGKKVSIVMPVYQGKLWISKSIDSVLEQTYTNFELILIDDNSTDGSGEICDTYRMTDERVSVFHFVKRKGVSKARNKGIELATGDWILFVDSDDLIRCDTLEETMKITNQFDVDIVVFSFQRHYMDGSSEVVCENIQDGIYQRKQYKEIITGLLEKSIAHNIGTKLYSKSVIAQIKFDEMYMICEDVDFFLSSLLHARALYFMKEPFYQYEMKNSQSLMRLYKENYFEASINMFKKVRSLFDDEFYTYAEWYYLYYLANMRAVVKNAVYQRGFDEIYKVCNYAETVEAWKCVKKTGNHAGSLKARLLNWLIGNKMYLIIWVLCKARRK